jgi:hypothetical protein
LNSRQQILYLIPVSSRLLVLLLLISFGFAPGSEAATGRVIKVLPHFLDLKGHHTLSPSLYERDAYQVYLRDHPDQRSGIRYDIQWRFKGPPKGALKLRLQLRGIAEGDLPKESTLEQEVTGKWLSQWSAITLSGESFKNFGKVTAWRVTLWDDDQLLGEQKSFLW